MKEKGRAFHFTDQKLDDLVNGVNQIKKEVGNKML